MEELEMEGNKGMKTLFIIEQRLIDYACKLMRGFASCHT